MKTTWKCASAAAALVAFAASCEQQQAGADYLIVNARIMTVSPDMTWADAMAVKDGRIVAVGARSDVEAAAGAGTVVEDFGGSFIMPGFVDQHVHTFFAGEEMTYFCPVKDSMALDALLAQISACAEETADGDWIRGGPWGSQLLPEFYKESSLAALDEAAKGHPLILRDDTAHNVIVNSAALDVIGFDNDSENPEKGEIVRDPSTGNITGLLFESAAKIAHQAVAARSVEDDAVAVEAGVARLNSVGVTSFLDAAAPPRVARAYNHLDNTKGLNARAAITMNEGVLTVYSAEDLETLVAMRGEFHSPNVLPDYVKFFLDGIPPTYTARYLEPYLPTEQFGDEFYGPIYYSPDELARLVTKFDGDGVTIKIHATADGSVRAALDAFEAARGANGDSGLPHQIAHAGYIHPDDRGRFASLGVVVDACPTFWFPQIIVTAIGWAVGEERANQYWPFRDLLDQDAIVALGSDWPVLPDPNPLIGVEGMVTRRDPHTNGSETLWASQAITLEEAVRTATINAAKALNLASETGSLETGKSADFIVFDRNLFDIPIEEVSEARVMRTYYKGRMVYDSQ